MATLSAGGVSETIHRSGREKVAINLVTFSLFSTRVSAGEQCSKDNERNAYLVTLCKLLFNFNEIQKFSKRLKTRKKFNWVSFPCFR